MELKNHGSPLYKNDMVWLQSYKHGFLARSWEHISCHYSPTISQDLTSCSVGTDHATHLCLFYGPQSPRAQLVHGTWRWGCSLKAKGWKHALQHPLPRQPPGGTGKHLGWTAGLLVGTWRSRSSSGASVLWLQSPQMGQHGSLLCRDCSHVKTDFVYLPHENQEHCLGIHTKIYSFMLYSLVYSNLIQKIM